MTAATATVRLRGRELAIERGSPLLMGVVNASPESFFDGGRHAGLAELVAHGRALAAAGAAIVDVGGQSGVTHLPAVPVEEEVTRVVPLVERLAGDGLIVSVDTWSAEVASAAIEAGAAMVNDPSGLTEAGVAEACARSGAGLVITHTRAAPKHKEFPAYEDVRDDVVAFLRERAGVAGAVGVDEAQILLDPGPDLGKTPAETVAALRDLPALARLGRPLLLSVSRKDFVGAICARAPGERLGGTLAAVGEGIDAGVSMVRTHDVAAVADFMAVRAALRGERPVDAGLRLEEALRREGRAA
ncbi:MAG: dihydropteroate synthase [Thermoleophilaceae bacterium]